MFTSRQGPSERHGRQGSRPASFAELRLDLARPSRCGDGNRQRLLDLAQRVARIQALGGEYSRVSLSEHALAATSRDAAAV